ncbi:T9SS type A sorting domain-containing protein [Hymenobacter armeniacus]|uniref:T9SS type A sorting domain-containing protein n=1 Tax=Hymenobacter armeniacus TaxID=2771358 RepID=A0ABR8JYF6_9BACT|nr:T9SS type A sorting domain-containing protein [Hymenobacter armeniacus]MBD2723986.1 T9SS type A sorting domain-containing protein [Hymenobacter armeniacus]
MRAGGSTNDFPQAITLAGSSIYMTGAFSSPTCAFGSNTLTNAGNATQDVFVAKLTDAGSTGAFVWAQRGGGSQNDSANGICVSGPNVYIAGSCSGLDVVFGTTTVAGGGFAAKLVDAGASAAFAWAQRTGASANAVAVGSGGVYLVGNFVSSTAVFGATTLTNAGGNDVFVAKLTDSGTGATFPWAVRAGGAGVEAGFGVAVSGTDVYITGSFASSTCTFGTSTLLNAGGQDAYVAKLTDSGSSGAFVWADRLGGTGNDYGFALAVQGPNVYVSGSFSSPTADAGATTLVNAGTGYDLFLARLTNAGLSGGIAWALRAGGAGNDYAGSPAVIGTGVYLGGSVAPPASFGSLPVMGTSASVGFLASLNDATALATNTLFEKSQWGLSPNPAHSSTCIVVPQAIVGLKGALIISDALGRQVRSELMLSLPSAVPLAVSGLPRGLYFVRLVVPGQTLTQRLLLD